ncbi:MAG: hypothetical protein H6577_19040 [Lewinellaceae bacterium]|nr:hypothetical protein [Saprospiraceae bacterium]MCB9340221.1 hypothetical protein [Lewinellaceae bacterium]
MTNRFHFLALAIFSLLLSNCDKNDKLPECPQCDFTCLDGSEPNVFSNDCKDNWDCLYRLHENSQLNYVLEEYFDQVNINAGNKLVFETNLSTLGEANIADDEVTDFLYFEIDPSQESFAAEGDELDLLNVRFQQQCFCANVHFRKPASGCMQGQKIDDSHWKIQANLVIEYDSWTQEVRVDAVYAK